MATHDQRTSGPNEPAHPDDEATLHERSDGAHAEQATDAGSLRADDSAPGVDAEDGEDPAEDDA